ncbi:hypothetical protein [Nocardiopsis sp. CC223A]|uniref:hypothetical protein n=1 Tax=Nocardiopsis sp. CC223A TaxID=3044051 RepID=UPI00278C55AC|nr:hypothetical protein [Nocardiopsis sp. CC223A]
MRKHRTRWVATLGVVALAAAGPVGLAGSALADEEDARELSWPVVRQGQSSYSLDGYEIGYLPPGLERYGINATSITDRQGGRQSQLSWVQGPDQLYGRVSVIRSEAVQDLDDLRESRYSHIPDRELELVEGDAAFEDGAYLSEETGDLFWMARPGVAVAAHLQPDRWEVKELRRMAEEVVEEPGAAQEPAQEPVEQPAEEAAEEAAEEPEEPVEATPEPEEVVDEVVDEGPETPETPVDTPEAPETPEVPEAPVETPELPAETPEAPVETPETPEAPVETPEAPVDELPSVPEDPDTPEIPGTPVDDVVDEAPETPEAPEAPVETPEVPVETPEAPVETPVDDAVTLPGQGSREVKNCLLDRFVDFESGETGLDGSQLAQDSGEFVEQALGKEDLDDAERDRLLATVWYYGDEGDKNAAIDTCAQENELERAQVEQVVAELADLIAELAAEAEAAVTEAEKADDDADAAVSELDTVDDEEWRELWDSLPWSVPSQR